MRLCTRKLLLYVQLGFLTVVLCLVPGNSQFAVANFSVSPVTQIATPFDCSHIQPSHIGQQVQEVINNSDFGGYGCASYVPLSNQSPNSSALITLPPAREAFAREAGLIVEAKYEVDIVVMRWEESEASSVLMDAIQALYNAVKTSPCAYPEGMKVRILIGLQDLNDHREYVAEELTRRIGEFDAFFLTSTCPDGANWKVEIAYYRNAFPIDPTGPFLHDHVKLLLVDGRHIIVKGYNIEAEYTDDTPTYDMGVELTGLVAMHTLSIFDHLWADARLYPDNSRVTNSTHSESVLMPDWNQESARWNADYILPAYSLYRDENTDIKILDNAIVAAINASQEKIDILQLVD